MMKRLNLEGLRFGRLVALSDSGSAKGQRLWQCQCDCGQSAMVRAAALRSGNTRSCCCLFTESVKESFTTHGAKSGGVVAPEYVVWSLMRNRCNNPNNEDFAYYGGRGIRVTPRWDDFSVFLSDMGPRPPLTTIDRIESDGNYEPGNCRWATRKEQSRNRAYCKRVMWDGKERLLWELADEFNIPVHTVHQRLYRNWTLEKTLTQPIRRTK